MSRDVGGWRNRRRRLLIYRPSPNDVQTPPTLQEQEVTPDTEPPLQTSGSGSHGSSPQGNAWLKTIPSRDGVQVHQREPLLRTNCFTDLGEIAKGGHPLQTPSSRHHRGEAQCAPPLQTPSSRHHRGDVQHGPPLQTPSSRHHRVGVQHGPPLQTPSSRHHRGDVQHGPPLQTPSSRHHMEAQYGPPLQTPSSRHHMEAQYGPPLQTPSSRHHMEAQYGPPLQTPSRHHMEAQCAPPLQTPSRHHMEAQCAPPLQTPSSTHDMEAQCAPPLQTPSRHDMEAQCAPPLQTPSSRHDMEAQCAPPLQTPSSRHDMEAQCAPPLQTPHISDPWELNQHGHQIQTPPSRHGGPRSDHLARLLASPLERTANRILLVELHDVSRQVAPFVPQAPPTERTSLSGDCFVFSSSSPQKRGDVHDVVLPGSDPLPRTPPPPSQPPVLHRWGLVPLFHSVRSKLENFAEIFFSPMKSRREAEDQQVVEPQPRNVCPGDPSVRSAADPPNSPPPTSSQMEAEDDQKPSASNTDVNLHLSIEISSSVPTLCRPPLQRCQSCPLQPPRPLQPPLPRRYSLDTADQDVPACPCRAKISRRRHSMGTVEECRKLPLSPISLTCLRKEKHPSALRTNRQPGSVLQYAMSSPPGRCLDGVRGTELSTGDTEGSDPLSQGTKECKVSKIGIRKRVARREGSLTPMGLPKRLRLHKDNFSLEEIYTNQNYRTPTEKRKFETIFEEPVMKGGALILTSQRPLRRIMVFKDSSAPRRRKKRGRGGGGRTRRCAEKKGNFNFELLLKHKLDQLEAELQHEEDTELN